MPLPEVVAALMTGAPLAPRTVVYTVDDGYADFAEEAMPIFAEFDCPAAIFVVTGFLDGETWLWWDRIECAFRDSRRADVKLEIAGVPHQFALGSATARHAAFSAVSRHVEFLPLEQREATIRQVELTLEVDLPRVPPPAFQPMTWTQLQRCASAGATVGPHTVTHPILSQASPDRIRDEIAGSWARLTAQVPAAVPIFCYPNGSPAAYGAREVAAVADAGLGAALSTAPHHVHRGSGLYEIPRFWLDHDHLHFQQVVSGLDRIKASLRGA